jgi:predicted dehydrogenase
MDKIAIAVVGPGQIGKQHIALIRDNPACHLAALVAPDHTHQHQLAHELAVPLYHSIENMLAAQLVDGVVVCSPNVFHVAQTSACVRAGVAVLVEKPLAHTYEDGLRLVELVEQTGAKVIVGHHRAHSPIMASARAIIAQGRLGRIVSITGSALFCKPAQYFADGPWRTVAGGGPILINLIHEIGNYRSLCGEITGVQAISSNAVRGFAVEDTVAIIFQFASGALGTFMLSDTAASARSWEQSSGENSAYPNYADEDCYVVAGTAGSLAIPTMRIKTTPAGLESSWWTPFDTATVPVERKNPLVCQLEHFLNLIRGTEAPVVSAFDGLQNLRVAEAISNSAATRTMVML